MKTCLCLLSLITWPALADDLGISNFSANGTMAVTNAFPTGVVTVEKALTVTGPWLAQKNAFSLAPQVQVQLDTSGDAGFYRALTVDLSGPGTHTNLFQSYGTLTTIAGSGNIVCSACNSWSGIYEGGLATAAALSSPHIAMADAAGNIYIADKRAFAIRKVTPDGYIYTVAGNNVQGGHGVTDPAPATSVSLNQPNGLFVFPNGMFYLLDRDNGYIRKVDTDGTMTTVVNHGYAISGGRGLWVSPDESLIYYSAGSTLMRWDSTNGLTSYVSGFSSLGNMGMDPNGNLVVTDDSLNQVFRIDSDGNKTVIAGNGLYSGGGDGSLATDTSLVQVRGIWFLPTGGYFLATDGPCQVWYVDLQGYIHLVLNGAFHAHSGDGAWFYDNPTAAKMSNGKQITMDYDGNLLVTESDQGFVRKIQFLRHGP